MARRNFLDDIVPYVIRAANEIAENMHTINALNVFPVPDGDTGTNMFNSLTGIVDDLQRLGSVNPNPTSDEVWDTVQKAALMHASGNSGVILSHFIRGAVGVLRESRTLNMKVIEKALIAAKNAAYTGVDPKKEGKAKEGTMLTVISTMADAATTARKRRMRGGVAAEYIAREALVAADKTPEMIQQLVGVRVMDAGAYGLAIATKGIYELLVGKVMKVITTEYMTAAVMPESISEWQEGGTLYHVQFVLRGGPFDEGVIREFLTTVGDSEQLVMGESEANIHVHTNEPWKVLEYFSATGELVGETTEIHNMRDQAEEYAAKLKLSEPPKPLGVVAVAAGKGIVEILTDLGVDRVVDGGQTANPSVADILKEVERVHALEVLILPGNANIVMAAQEAAKLSSKTCAVVETKYIQETIAALYVLDLDSSLKYNVAAMAEAASGVISGAVTKAVSKSKTEDGKPVETGDYIGISGKCVLVTGRKCLSAGVALLNSLTGEAGRGAEIITLIVGTSRSVKEVQELADLAQSNWPDADVQILDGGQPVYDILISIG
jgi:hypothetical protein